MNKLVSTSQAAKILGLSLQGVHYRIKNNKLNSVQKDGKTFVYVDESLESKEEKVNLDFLNNKLTENNNLVLKEKNKQIKLLKKSIKWMDKQYKSEIKRLEENQNKIIEVFNSEIKLLQSAFNEMRSIYHQKNNRITKDQEFISVKDFFILMKKYGKTNNQIKLIIIDALKSSDSRFIYNKDEKTILILKNAFRDLI